MYSGSAGRWQHPSLLPQESAETRCKGYGVSHLALPDDEHPPPQPTQTLRVPPVPRDIPRELRPPVALASGHGRSPAPAAVAMPEAAPNVNHLPQANQDDIWSSWQVGPMQTKPIAESVYESAHHQLGPGIRLPDERHPTTALPGGQEVHAPPSYILAPVAGSGRTAARTRPGDGLTAAFNCLAYSFRTIGR